MSKRVFHSNSVVELLSEEVDRESIVAQILKLNGCLEDLGKRLEDYRLQLEAKKVEEKKSRVI